MNYVIRFFACFLYILTLSSCAHLKVGEVDLIRSRLYDDALLSVPSTDELRNTYAQFNFEEGIFKDLDYVDSSNAHWGPALHLYRLTQLAVAYRLKGTVYFENPTSLKIIEKGVDYWAARMFKNHNWWVNEIGIPLQTYRQLILVGDLLNPAARDRLIKITQVSNLRSSADAQNLIWYSEVLVGLGAYTGNTGLIRSAVQDATSTLAYDQSQGLRVDQSFWQHGPVLYSGGYGGDFSRDLARFFRWMKGTQFAFTEKQVKILTDYIIDGQLWLSRGITYNYSVIGRNFSRPGSGNRTLQEACKNMELDCEKGKRGNRHFWNGDMMVQQEPGFSFSVKMYSRRLLNNDTTPNREGLWNDYLSDGLTYIFRDGNEYRDIFPVLDYTRVPGVTETDQPLVERDDSRNFGLTDFVGGVSDGKSGIAVMDFKRGTPLVPLQAGTHSYVAEMKTTESLLVAKKAWFFTEHGLVALGAGIQYSGKKHLRGNPVRIRTSINQTWARTPVYTSKKTLESGQMTGENIQWLNHDHIAYLILDGSSVTVQAMDQSGSWNRINRMQKKDLVTGKVFSAWVNHLGRSKSNYAYAIVSGIEPDATAALYRNPGFSILSNTSSLQAVHQKLDTGGDLIQAVFHAPGKLKVVELDGLTLSSKNEVLAQLKLGSEKWALSVSNPRNEALQAVFLMNRKLSCASCQFDKVKHETTVTVSLPSGPLAGSTRTLELIQSD